MEAEARTAYLGLLKDCLTRTLVIGEGRSKGRRRRGIGLVMHVLASRGYLVVPTVASVQQMAVRHVRRLPGSGVLARVLARRRLSIIPDPDAGRYARSRVAGGRPSLGRLRRELARTERELGLDWPEHAETMIGRRRLDNVERCVVDVLERDVPGDLIEAGVWRGGTTIMMRAILAAYGDPSRRVWVADSFEGLPKPDAETYPADADLDYTVHSVLSVGERQVRANFARYGLLDERVQFLSGWFADTLASAPVDQIAVLRVDGDLYESTMDALEALYPRLSVGGYCIIDDYGALAACRLAVDDYRTAHGITEEIRTIDWTGVYWRRETPDGG